MCVLWESTINCQSSHKDTRIFTREKRNSIDNIRVIGLSTPIAERFFVVTAAIASESDLCLHLSIAHARSFASNSFLNHCVQFFWQHFFLVFGFHCISDPSFQKWSDIVRKLKLSAFWDRTTAGGAGQNNMDPEKPKWAPEAGLYFKEKF
jgi:hypothetical protein